MRPRYWRIQNSHMTDFSTWLALAVFLASELPYLVRAVWTAAQFVRAGRPRRRKPEADTDAR